MEFCSVRSEIKLNNEILDSDSERIKETTNEFINFNEKFGERLSLEKAQENIEFFHNRSKEQILELHGEFISGESYDRIIKGVDSIRAVKYNQNKSSIGAFYYHNGETNIEVCNLDREQLERTTQHETNHFMSFNKETQQFIDYESLERKCNKISGIHECEFVVDSKDNICEFKDLNRGFNEGITQMYTNRQLEAIAPYKGELSARQNGYQYATELSEQVEGIVGPEMIAKAYYGGELKPLEEKINQLGGKGSFARFSKDIDVVTYSIDYVERLQAMRDAQGILASMSEGGIQ